MHEDSGSEDQFSSSTDSEVDDYLQCRPENDHGGMDFENAHSKQKHLVPPLELIPETVTMSSMEFTTETESSKNYQSNQSS